MKLSAPLSETMVPTTSETLSGTAHNRKKIVEVLVMTVNGKRQKKKCHHENIEQFGVRCLKCLFKCSKKK